MYMHCTSTISSPKWLAEAHVAPLLRGVHAGQGLAHEAPARGVPRAHGLDVLLQQHDLAAKRALKRLLRPIKAMEMKRLVARHSME